MLPSMFREKPGPRTRPPAVAGTFFPADARELREQIEALLAGAAPPDDAPPPRALILPHAG